MPTGNFYPFMLGIVVITHECMYEDCTLQTWRSLRRYSINQSFRFRVFDRNGDGYISKQEFKHCMMHFGERFTDEEVEEMMSEADTNNDGKIDYSEFSQVSAMA